MELYEHVGTKIRELRQNYGGKGLSQEALATEMHTTANTISRWETASYKPSLKDLQKLASFFGVSISVFLPDSEDSRFEALMSATGDLDDEDLRALTEYAQFRKARRKLEQAGKQKRKRAI